MSYEKEKYLTNIENLKKTLDEFGVAIIPDVLNKEEQKSMKDGGWDYLEHITSDFETPISRWNTKTWRNILNFIQAFTCFFRIVKLVNLNLYGM